MHPPQLKAQVCMPASAALPACRAHAAAVAARSIASLAASHLCRKECRGACMQLKLAVKHMKSSESDSMLAAVCTPARPTNRAWEHVACPDGLSEAGKSRCRCGCITHRLTAHIVQLNVEIPRSKHNEQSYAPAYAATSTSDSNPSQQTKQPACMRSCFWRPS